MAGSPYVRRAYPGPRDSRVADLLLRAGQLTGQAETQRGQIAAGRYRADADRSARAAESIASMIAGAGQQIGQYYAQAPQREMATLQLDAARAQAQSQKVLTAALDQAGGDLGRAIVLLEAQGHGAAAMTLRDKRREQLAQESTAALTGYKVRGEQFGEANRLVAAALADPALYPKITPRLRFLADSIEKGWGELVPEHYDPKALKAFDQFTLTEAERATRIKNLAEQAQAEYARVKNQNELDAWGRDFLAQYFAVLDPQTAKPEDFQGAIAFAKNRGVNPTVLAMFGEDVSQAVGAAKKLLTPRQAPPQLGSVADLIASEEKKLGRPLTKEEKLRIERQHTDATDRTPNVAAGDVTELSPAALDAAAHQWAMTGALPPLGVGRGAGSLKTKIMNRGAEMYANLDLPSQIAAFNAAKTSLAKRSEQLSALSAFEDTAMKNLERFLEIAETIPDSGIPWLNRPLREISDELLASPDMAAFNTARRAVIPEFARIITNPNLVGVLSDSARHEVDTLLRGDYTLPQIKASAAVLVQDAKNRKESMQEEIAALSQRLASPPKARPAGPGDVPDAVRQVLQGQPPDEYELSDGSVWVVAADGTIRRKS